MDADDINLVTMPKWPAWIMLVTMCLCAYPALTANAPTPPVAPRDASRVAAAEKPSRPAMKPAVSAKVERTRN